jgi:hypothetical protein
MFKVLRKREFAAATAWAILAMTAPVAGDGMREEVVQLGEGNSSTKVSGNIVGGDIFDYRVEARAGQMLNVVMESDHRANYFNVLPPDDDTVAVFVGSAGGSRFTGDLDLDGDWKIRVYLMRAAARRGEEANYTLNVTTTGSPDPDKAREANDFGPREWDARGKIGCARGGQPMQTAACSFKVVRYRYEEGATVFVVPPGSGDAVRMLYYLGGNWSTNSAELIDSRKRADLWSLVVGDEAYEIPDAVIFGG